MTLPERIVLYLVIAGAGWLLLAVAASWVKGLGDPWREPGPWPDVPLRRGRHAGYPCLSCRPGGFGLGPHGDFDTTPGMRALKAGTGDDMTGWDLPAVHRRYLDELQRRRAQWASLARGSRGTGRRSPARSQR